MKIPKLIPAGKHDWTLIDEEDYEALSKRKWYLSAQKYAVTHALKREGLGKMILSMHWVILGEKSIDHKNGNSLDNRRSNLRICTQAQNTANQRVARTITKSSRFKGVSFRTDRERWTAYIGTGKGRDCLGCYATEEEAARAYNKKATERYGEFARLNDVP